jgi:nucleotide-binding universal stress UspA family protein
MDLGEIYKKNSEENVQKAIDHISTKYSDKEHSYEGISSYNVLNLEVKDLVASKNIDCIIMGTNGASGLKEVFVGSQTMHVIKDAKVPVIGVPVGYAYKNPKDVLFATDYRSDSSQKGLPLLEELCSKHTSRLIFLNAYYGVALDETQLKNKEALDHYFKHDAHLTEIADGVDVLEAIEDFQSRHRIDLLVLVHNKHNFFENLLFTPVVRKVAHHSDVPFLILPPFKF